MNTILGVLLAITLTLGLLAGIVFGLGDRTMFVPPPEAVAESFMRQLTTGRYARALPYLSDDLAARTTPDTLRALTDRLQNRTGKILNVRGDPVSISGDQAEANATLKTKAAGEPAFNFKLTRQEGVWKISDIGSLDLGFGRVGIRKAKSYVLTGG
jgi:hypothetical protein